MFRATGKQSSTDDNGVTIRSVDRHRIEYRWHNRSMFLNREGAIGPGGETGQIVYVGPEDRWNPPYDRDVPTPELLRKIEADVVESYRALGSYIEIVRG